MRMLMVAAVGLLVLATIGCGQGGPRTYTVNGKIELASGKVADLEGSIIEAALESDTLVRASGVIHGDGTFALETLQSGQVLRGALEGTYQARLIPGDEDPASTKRARAAIPKSALQFNTSRLTFQVPAPGEVLLKVNLK